MLGFRSVPVVSSYGTSVSGVNLGKIAQLLDLDFDPSPALGPERLLERLNRFLRAIEQVAPQISTDVLHKKLPGRDRSVLQLLHHTVDVAYSFMAGNEVSETDQISDNSASDRSMSLVSLSRKIQFTLSNLEAKTTEWQSTTETPYGQQTMHQVLERCAWHVAQHIRQLEHFCGKWQRAIRGWPSLRDYERLPLPEVFGTIDG